MEIEEILALIYRKPGRATLAVAEVCDNVLDKSGAMLGRVRDLAYPEPIPQMPLNHYINMLSHKELFYLHKFEVLNFACDGDRRKTQTLRNGLRKFVNSTYGKENNFNVDKLQIIIKGA